MSFDGAIFMGIFWTLILGFCGITLVSLLKHQNKR